VAALFLCSNGLLHGEKLGTSDILNELIVKRGILIQFFVQYGAAQVGGGPKDPKQP
jgi:hypothetical protein